MKKELSQDSKFEVSLKTLGGIAVLYYQHQLVCGFTLQADIDEAKLLPISTRTLEVTKMEFDMKDQMVRQNHNDNSGGCN